MFRSTLTASSVLLCTALACAVLLLAPPPASSQCDPAWVLSNPANIGQGDNGLGSVAAISSTDIWAVGNSVAGSRRNNMRQHWNGTSWTPVAGPKGQGPQNFLTGVTAVATNDVWAVGFTASSDLMRTGTHAEHWNGSTWTTFTTPNRAGTQTNSLYGVWAAGANDVWAVGETTTFSNGVTLIEHWNGSTWTIVNSPSPGTYGRLNAISGTSPSDIWAVGNDYEQGIQVNLVLHYNGSTWSRVTAPNDGPFVQMLQGVHARAANDVWAVGWHLAVFGVDQVYQTTALHYDGAQWSLVNSPDVNQENNYLYSVSALSATDAWAVGFFDTGFTLDTTIQHWDGVSWSRVDSPNGLPGINELVDVVAISPTDAWAVGQTFGSFSFRTLGAHLVSPCSTSVAAAPKLPRTSSPSVRASITSGDLALSVRALGGDVPLRVDYTLPSAAHVNVSILDARGAMRARLVDETQDAGAHSASWSERIGAGLYFAVLDADGRRLVRRVVIAR